MSDITSRAASFAAVNVLPAPGGPTSSSGGSAAVSGSGRNSNSVPSAAASSPAVSTARSFSGTPWKLSAARDGGGREASGDGGGLSSSGSSAAVTSTPSPTWRDARISASWPSSARTRAIASAILGAR